MWQWRSAYGLIRAGLHVVADARQCASNGSTCRVTREMTVLTSKRLLRVALRLLFNRTYVRAYACATGIERVACRGCASGFVRRCRGPKTTTMTGLQNERLQCMCAVLSMVCYMHRVSARALSYHGHNLSFGALKVWVDGM